MERLRRGVGITFLAGVAIFCGLAVGLRGYAGGIGLTEDVEQQKKTGGLRERLRKVTPGWLLAGTIAGVVLVGGIVAPLALSHASIGQDAKASELLLGAVPSIRACAFFEGDGSYAGCDAAEMSRSEPEVRWEDGLAPVGWGKGGVGKVFVSDLDEKSFRVETTSATGKVFKYDFENGRVTRATIGAGGW